MEPFGENKPSIAVHVSLESEHCGVPPLESQICLHVPLVQTSPRAQLSTSPPDISVKVHGVPVDAAPLAAQAMQPFAGAAGSTIQVHF